MSSRTLGRIEAGSLCAGCGACALVSASVEMRVSEQGFLRPAETAPVSDADDGTIAAVCPGLSLSQTPGAASDHLLWGPVASAWTGFAADPELRFAGSSGGVLSALLVHLLESGQVDAVVQTAAAAAPPYANRHAFSTTRAEILAAAGSRYAPSAPLAELGPLLDSGRRHAFVGKPCDVAALRAVAKRDARVDRAFPYMLSFFCAGVPSLAGAREIVGALGLSEDELAGFRYRGNGWPGKATAETADGQTREMSYADSWGGILSRHVQFRCKVCPDGTGGFADAVCADAWHCDERGYPLFEESDGVSLLLGRTAKGEKLIRGAVDAGAIELKPFGVDGIAPMQPGQVRRKRLAWSRIAALRAMLRPAPRFSGFRLREAARSAGVAANLRSFLGTCRRIALRKLD